MKTQIFIDTSAFYAMVDVRDQYHNTAADYIGQLISRKNVELVTSNLVLAETYSLLLYRVGYKTAIEFLRKLFSFETTVLYSGRQTELSALQFLEKYDDMKLSFVDAVSFQLMKEHKIKSAFTFDKHFEIVGFECLTDH